MQIYCGDDSHVGLPPFASAVGHLRLEQLERVEAELRLRHLQRFAQDRARLVLHQKQSAMRFSFRDLLKQPEKVDVGKEEAGGVVRDRRLR